MINVAIGGAGMMGVAHARAYAKLPDVRVVGVSSGSAAKAAALAHSVGAQPFTDVLALATRPDVDAVSITLPTHLHADVAVAALRAGKHVLVEKPMALTVAECDAMIAAQSGDALLMVAHVLRFWPEYIALAEYIGSGALGQPLMASAARLSTRPQWGAWFANPDWTGGAVHDLHIHDLDALNWLFGVPQRVFAVGQRGAPGGWDHVVSTLEYGAIKASAEASVLMPPSYPFTMALRVVCERGAVEFNSHTAGVLVYDHNGGPQRLLVDTGDAYERQIEAFVGAIRSGRAPEHGTPVQARLAVQTALAVRQSLETGTSIGLTQMHR